jgi:hypothetical protein
MFYQYMLCCFGDEKWMDPYSTPIVHIPDAIHAKVGLEGEDGCLLGCSAVCIPLSPGQ